MNCELARRRKERPRLRWLLVVKENINKAGIGNPEDMCVEGLI